MAEGITGSDKNKTLFSMIPDTWNCETLFETPGKAVLFLKGLQTFAKTSEYLQQSLGNKLKQNSNTNTKHTHTHTNCFFPLCLRLKNKKKI